MAGLYLHIPFCKQACHYCDFHFSTGHAFRQEVVQAMVTEIGWQKEYLRGEPLSTIYFGGGTPSLLAPDELDVLLRATRSTFEITADPEITLEANPDDIDPARLLAMKQLGFNRLSIGIQSFDNDILRLLNRAHDKASALSSFQAARTAGFSNITIDLMYAIPGQSDSTWNSNVEEAIKLKPDHISAYALTIEKKTAFGHWQETGKLQPMTDDKAATQYELLMDSLEHAGYEHYEISNFGRPGFHSRHNTAYWQQVPYLGIGPSAHSYDRDSRQFTVSNNATYCHSIAQGRIPFEREVLTRENKINEYVFTNLRTMWGCNLERINADFQYDLIKTKKKYLDTLVEKGLATLQQATLVLTRSGKLVADQVAADLFVPAGSLS